jgi:hypothetical protein
VKPPHGPALERFPIRWTQLIKKESLKFKELGPVLVEKLSTFPEHALAPSEVSAFLKEKSAMLG